MNSQRLARPALVFQRIAMSLGAYQAVWGAGGCVYMFYLSAHPAVQPALLLGWSPTGVVLAVAGVAVVTAGWLWMILPALLVVFGLIHWSVTVPAGWRWLAAWLGAVAAGTVLEVLTIFGANIDWLFRDPAYPPPPRLSWVSLAEAAGFLLVGAAMIAAVIGMARTAKRRQAFLTPMAGLA